MSVEVIASSYLASGHELQRAQRAPQVGDVVLEVLKGIVDGDLNLRRRGAGRAVGSDLRVVSRHGGGWWSCRRIEGGPEVRKNKSSLWAIFAIAAPYKRVALVDIGDGLALARQNARAYVARSQ